MQMIFFLLLKQTVPNSDRRYFPASVIYIYTNSMVMYELMRIRHIYCQTLFRVLSAGVLCTLRVAGWKPTSNHIEITIGFFYLHKGWLSLHRGHPVNVLIRRTMRFSSVSFRGIAYIRGMTEKSHHLSTTRNWAMKFYQLPKQLNLLVLW